MRSGSVMRGYRNEMAAPLLLRHPSSQEHDTGPHPERIARIVAIERALSERDWLGWDVRESPAVQRDVLCAVHPEAYVERSAALSAAGRRGRDPHPPAPAGALPPGLPPAAV